MRKPMLKDAPEVQWRKRHATSHNYQEVEVDDSEQRKWVEPKQNKYELKYVSSGWRVKQIFSFVYQFF